MRRAPALLATALVLGSAGLAAPAGAPAFGGSIIQNECGYQPGAIGEWWAIPGCEAVVTPWISVGRLGHSGWKLFCPSGAPLMYQNVINVGVDFFSGGADWQRSSKWIDWPTANGSAYTGNVSTWQSLEGKTLNPADYSSGWLDAYVVNWSAGGSHSWRFAIGCSAINAPSDPNTVQWPFPPDGPDAPGALDEQNIVPSADPPATDDEMAPIATAPATPPIQPASPPPPAAADAPAPLAAAARARRGEVRRTHLKRRSRTFVRADQRVERLREVPLAPNRTSTVDISCRAGEKAVHGQYAIAYDTPRPPARRTHADTFAMGDRTYSVRVRLGRVARGAVWVQARVICERR